MKQKLQTIINELHELIEEFRDEIGIAEEYTQETYPLQVAQEEFDVIVDVTERLEEIVD